MVSSRLNLETAVVPSNFQSEVLAYLIKDKEVLGRFIEILTEENFENPIHRIAYKIVREHFRRFVSVPSRKVMEREIEALIRDNRQGFVPAESFWRELDYIYRIPTPDREYVVEKVQQYVVKSSLGLMAEAALAAAESDVPDVEAVSKVVSDFYSMLSGRVKERMEFLLEAAQQRIRENPAVDKIPTGLQNFDRVLGGGLGKGELGILMAPSGYGKSHFLVTVGSGALRLRKNVVHVTLEISKRTLLARYEAFNSRVPKNALYMHDGQVLERLMRLRRLVQADVLAIEFPTRGLTVNSLRSVLMQVTVSKSFYPDLLIVDYGDIMKPEGVGREAKMYEQQKVIFEQLRGLAQDFQIPVWTASQASKKALGKEVVTMMDIAESFGKVQVADVVAALCQTADEKIAHRGRFYIEKVRESKAHVKITFQSDFDRSAFIEGPDAHPEQADEAVEEFSGGVTREELEQDEQAKDSEEEELPF